MSIDQEERRRDLRNEVRKRVEARAVSTSLFNMQDMVFGMLIDMIADLQGRVDELERMIGSEGPSRQNGRMGDMGEEKKEAAPEATPEGTESQTEAAPAEAVKPEADAADAPPSEPENSEPTKPESGQDEAAG